MTVWMTECKGDCSTWSKPSEGEWFKIYQAGLLSGTIGHGHWGTNEMMSKGFSLTVKIPATLKPGNYLIRHETIVSSTHEFKKEVLFTNPAYVESCSSPSRVLS
jgi:hypothetical protein